MTQELAMQVCREAIWVALLVAAPMLIAGLVVGIIISLLQAVTQIQEMTLTFIPKILAVVTVLILSLPWTMNVILSYTRELFAIIKNIQ
ncbi:MAG: flagellar biosynthesis protein FliQ [bacterium]